MERDDANPNPSEVADQLERRTDALGRHIDEARESSDRAQPDADLPFAMGDFNEDSSDGAGGEGVTPETNYTTRGD